MKDESKTSGVLATPACFRQRVNLPAAQVAGLAEAELATALAFEIEPFSGVPRAEGELAWRACPDPDAARRVFDVVQIRRTDLAAAVDQARREGRRVTAITAVPDEARGERAEDLPCIPVRGKGVLKTHPYLLWSAVCLLAAGFFAAEGVRLAAEVGRLRRDVAERRGLQSEKESLEAKAAGLRRQAAEIRGRRAEEAKAQARAGMLRAAGRILLEAVPGACGDDSVVRAIGPGEDVFDLRLSGVSLSPETATRTVSRLTAALAAPRSGWTVKPGTVAVQTTGGACVFDCTFAFGPEGGSK